VRLQAKRDYEERIRKENEIRQAKLREIQRLEAREKELIERLNNTQRIQESEVENLCKVMSEPASGSKAY
jgi:hypothetical protein